jgi:AcrR family transcriptional regulator
VAGQSCRERLIDATLSLCVSCGYETTTVDQIAAAANVAPAEFARHFASKDAVVMCVAEDLIHATADALKHVDARTSPERALFIATTMVVGAILNNQGVVTFDRMIAMAQIVTANPNLRHQASLARRRILTLALADRLGVAAENRRVRQAVTMWSAIAAGAYLGARSMGEDYDPAQDDQIIERMIAELGATFADVMGNDPPQPDSASLWS